MVRNKKYIHPGFVNDAGMLSAHSNAILWNEYGYHPRWRVKNYSRIKLYDIRSGERTRDREASANVMALLHCLRKVIRLLRVRSCKRL